MKIRKIRKRPKTIAIRSGSSFSLHYMRELRKIAQYIIKQTKLILYPAIRSPEIDYTPDASPERIDSALKKLLESFAQIEFRAAPLARYFVNGIDSGVSKKISELAIKKFGVNAFKNNRKLEQLLKLKTSENAELIKSIPQEYFKKLSGIVYSAVAAGERASEIEEKIQKLGGVTQRRARFIAKDQIAKATAVVSKERYEAIGSIGYRWRTSMDERVRRKEGDPPGYWPYGKYSHYEREFDRSGKIFKWDKPPKDGHPGMAPGCRCYAEAVFPED